jgi:MerR family transcriptional regulator, aldehyde-responsive regulator
MADASPQSSFTIKDVARISGLPASTLRYYEAIGLLGPVRRDGSSGHRRYSEDDLNLAVALACLSTTRMSVRDMGAYLTNRAVGPLAAAAQVELLAAQANRLDAEARGLRLRQRYIAAKLAYWQAIAEGNEAGRTRSSAAVIRLSAALCQSERGQRAAAGSTD